MLEIFRSLTDDQVAIAGCVVALIGGGLMTQISYMFGPAARPLDQMAIHPLNSVQTLRSREDRAA